MENVKLKIEKYFEEFLNFLIKLKEKTFPEYQMNQEEIDIYNTLESLAKNKETVFKIAPLTNEILIQNTTLGYNISVNRDMIIIANYNFYFSQHFHYSYHEQMIEMLYKYIQADRDLLKSQMFANKSELLYNINLNINET